MPSPLRRSRHRRSRSSQAQARADRGPGGPRVPELTLSRAGTFSSRSSEPDETVVRPGVEWKAVGTTVVVKMLLRPLRRTDLKVSRGHSLGAGLKDAMLRSHKNCRVGHSGGTIFRTRQDLEESSRPNPCPRYDKIIKRNQIKKKKSLP